MSWKLIVSFLAMVLILTACVETDSMAEVEETTTVQSQSTQIIDDEAVAEEPSGEEEQATPSFDERGNAVAARMQAVFPADGPGGAVMIIQNGAVLYQGAFGLADVDSGQALTTESVFHLGSVGKQFTALGIMQLQEQGKLEYDQPVGKYISELAWMGEEVTIRRLLHHTSGIPDYDEDESLMDSLQEMAEMPGNADLIRLLADQSELTYEPGDEFLYSNTGYDLLGALIER